MIYDNMEECVHQQDPISNDTAGVKKHGLRGTIKGIGIEVGLYHHHRVTNVLTHKLVSVGKGGLFSTTFFLI